MWARNSPRFLFLRQNKQTLTRTFAHASTYAHLIQIGYTGVVYETFVGLRVRLKVNSDNTVWLQFDVRPGCNTSCRDTCAFMPRVKLLFALIDTPHAKHSCPHKWHAVVSRCQAYKRSQTLLCEWVLTVQIVIVYLFIYLFTLTLGPKALQRGVFF